MGLMGMSWIVIFVGIGALLWWLAGGSGSHRALRESPEDILKGRYARGEINKEGFEKMLSDLRR